ncbi:type II restriction endonuclease [Ureibacillus thermosphaericus]|uniref:type II restriction endonuclease n=1 Tax=Ureibacillus thermosphaericus TaxID=51173 RepID=UPI0030C8DFC2
MEYSYNEYTSLTKEERFDYLIETLSPTNRTSDYYVNWNKVYQNTKEIEIYLHLLNYLIGKNEIYKEALTLFKKYPESIRAIPTLLAIRETNFEVLHIDDKLNLTYENLDFVNIDTDNIEKYVDFANLSGLLDFLSNHCTKSLVDYVIGVEVGLDSNGRKNRSGTFMEKVVENKVKTICECYGLEYLPQATAPRILKKWNFELPYNESIRSHDFAIYNPDKNKLTIIEVNYYGGGGSKLKSVSGEFTELNNFFQAKNPNIQFVWITDGQGWHTAKKPLQEAFNEINHIINLDMLNNGYLEEILKL